MLLRTITAFLTFALACFASGHASAQDSLKIGYIATLSGPAAALGADSVDGFKLAVQKFGGKFGGRTVDLVVVDDQLKPETGIEQAKKLIDKDKPPIIVGTTFSNVVMAIVQPVTRANVLLISQNAGPSPLAGAQCNENFFAVAFLNDQIYEPVGEYLQKKGVKKAMVLAPNYQAGKDAIAGFKKRFKGEIVDEIYTPLAQLDFSAELTQIASKKPDVVFAFYPGGLAVNFVKQYDQVGLQKTSPLYGGFPLTDETVRKAQGKASVGIVTSGNWAMDLPNAANKEFIDNFRKTYNRDPSDYAAFAYDTALLIESAVRKVKGDTGNIDTLRAAVAEAKFASVRGNFRFNRNHMPVVDWYVRTVVEEGGATRIKTMEKIFSGLEDGFVAQCPLK